MIKFLKKILFIALIICIVSVNLCACDNSNNVKTPLQTFAEEFGTNTDASKGYTCVLKKVGRNYKYTVTAEGDLNGLMAYGCYKSAIVKLKINTKGLSSDDFLASKYCDGKTLLDSESKYKYKISKKFSSYNVLSYGSLIIEEIK